MENTARPNLIDPKYVDYWRQKTAHQAESQKQAADQAWQEVRQIARCLRQEFGAKRIVVFGSLVRGRFHPESDIDLAADQISPERYFAAVARANDFTSRWVDLKPLENLEPYFRDRILATGVEIDEGD